MNSKKQIKFGAMISYIAIFINIIATLIYTPWMVSKIGQANYGLYTLATSLISLFLVDFGISSALSRFLSKYRAEGKEKEIEKLMGATYKLYFAIDLIILLVLIGIYFFLGEIYTGLNDTELETFKILYILVAGFNIISFPCMTLNGILTSYEKFVQLKLCDLFRKIFTVLLVVLVLYFNMDVIAVVAANVVAGIITILIKLVIIKKEIHIKINFASGDVEIYKAIFGFSIWITVISFAQKFIYNMASSVLGIVSGAISIALYAPAASIGSYYYVVAEAINGLFLPSISRKIAENREEDIMSLMIKVGRFQMIILGLIFVGFVCIGKDFMILWMGADYVQSYYCAILILFPALLEYSQQIGKTTIIAKNLVKYQAIGFFAIAVLTLIVSFLLGKIVGAIGVCVSICLAGCLNVVWQSYIFSTKLHFKMKDFYLKCYLPMVVPMLASIILGLTLNTMILSVSWKSIIVKGIVITMIYLTSCFCFVLESEDRKNLTLRIRKLLK